MKITTDEIVENPILVRATVNRDERDWLNRKSLIALMLEHNITLPTRDFDTWRPTVPTRGQIEGVCDGLTCIMTNGLLGYFLREGREPLYGHITHFKWDTPVTSMIPYYNEKGERRFFQMVKDQGAPSALHCMAKDATISDEVKKSRPKGKSKRQSIIDSL